MAAQVQWFGLKPILIDSISGYCISNDFSMNSNKFSRLTGPSGPSFRAQKCPKMPKNQYFPSKMAAQVQWSGLKPILINFMSGYCISNDFSMNCNKFSPLIGSSGPSFRARKFSKIPKNQYFPSKVATQGQWFGLKMTLIDFISGYYILNDFSMNSNKLSTLTGPWSQKWQKIGILVLWTKM